MGDSAAFAGRRDYRGVLLALALIGACTADGSDTTNFIVEVPDRVDETAQAGAGAPDDIATHPDDTSSQAEPASNSDDGEHETGVVVPTVSRGCATGGCGPDATCELTSEPPHCVCRAGFAGDGQRCEDVDECDSGAHGCDPFAVCNNTLGSYTCTCGGGYSGDGRRCDDIDECEAGDDGCSDVALCENTAGSYACTCMPGYVGDGQSCVDIDECATGQHDCPELAVCSNTLGSFSCACRPGYEGDGTSCAAYRAGLFSRPANTGCVAPRERPPETTVFTTERVFPRMGFNWPVAMLQLPVAAGASWLIAEHTGRIYNFRNSPDATNPTQIVDLAAHINSNLPPGVTDVRALGAELGLVGLTVHPSFPDVPEIFVTYTINVGTAERRRWVLRLSSFIWLGGPIDMADETTLLEIPTAEAFHHAGTLGFDVDGFLLLSVGDGGPHSDPLRNAPNLNSLLGKMLRIDIDRVDEQRHLPYAIPADNPFATAGGAPEVWAYGLRNPWKWSFDRLTGELWVGDVGADFREEIDIVVPGGDYGWPDSEGNLCWFAAGCQSRLAIPPIFDYAHDSGGASVTGGYVYRGSSIPELQGTYIFGDFIRGTIWGLEPSGNQRELTLIAERPYLIGSFAEDLEGEIYVLPHHHAAPIERLIRAAAQSTFPPERLSQTGCVDTVDPREPAPGMIPYDVNVPFWSDAAQKRRWIGLPDGETISVDANGDWQFPVGTVLMKTFARAERLIETRLLMRHEDDWAGYSYEWNAEQTDASLLLLEKHVVLDSVGTWTFPSRAGCLRCHTAVAGRSLGPETAQMNRYVYYPETGRIAEQISTLELIGALDHELPRPMPALTPVTDDTGDLEERARAYLHVNCAYCHRAEGPTAMNMDLRYELPFSSTATCGIPPQHGDLGIDGALLVNPGSPEQSLISRRIHTLDVNQMPPLARNLTDTDGVAVIDAWISSLASCPP